MVSGRPANTKVTAYAPPAPKAKAMCRTFMLPGSIGNDFFEEKQTWKPFW